MHWWDKWPGRLEAESQAFVDCGIPHEIDPEAKEQGLLIIKASFPWEGREIPLVIEFPDIYPYFPPQVTSPNQGIRHQEPHEGGICLLSQAQDTWETTDKIANVIQDQLPVVIRIANGDQVAKEREEKLGIPLQGYMKFEEDSHLILPSLPKDISSGQGELNLRLSNTTPLRGIALEAKFNNSKNKLSINNTFQKNMSFYCRKEAKGYWAYIKTPPSSFEATEILKEIEGRLGQKLPKRLNTFKDHLPGRKKPTETILDIYAFAYHDELEHEKHLPTWIVVSRRKTKEKTSYDIQLVRAETENRQEIFKRIPEAAPLKKATVTCIGLGSIGSPIAIELAKAGIGKIHIIDNDVVESGNSVRWASGISAAGQRKSQHIAHMIMCNYPYTQIGIAAPIRIGSTASAYLVDNGKRTKLTHNEILLKAIADSDIIIDSSASIGIHNYLSRLSIEYKIPHIVVSATHGAWGGRVARLIPESTGCWLCLLHHENDGAIPRPIDKENDESIQPHGCLDPSFTGTSFDLMTISMMASRLAIGNLCHVSEIGYPDYVWDYASISFRNEDRTLCTPNWETACISPHPKCYCQSS